MTAPQPIDFSCPYCQQVLTAPHELFGQSIQCPACSETLTVPSPTLSVGPASGVPQNPVATPGPASLPAAAHALKSETSGLAIASLVCGILGFLTSITAVVGVVLGHMSLSRIKKSNGALGGRRLAIWGLVVSYLTILVSLVIGVSIYLLAGASQRAQLSKMRSDFRSLEIALESYRLLSGSVPTTEQGLDAVVEKPETSPVPRRWENIVGSLPVDPWGNSYRYKALGAGYELSSNGPDGVAGNSDDLRFQGSVSATGGPESPVPSAEKEPDLQSSHKQGEGTKETAKAKTQSDVSSPASDPLDEVTPSSSVAREEVVQVAVEESPEPVAPSRETQGDAIPEATEKELPSEETIAAGIEMLAGDIDRAGMRRGAKLVSGGGDGRVAGTVIYPIKVNGFPAAFYFSQDEFGDWSVGTEGMPKPVPMPRQPAKAPAKEAATSPVDGADAVRQLSALEAKIASEKKRWTDATAVINRFTNNKKTPVQEGTQAYYQCVEASKVIQAVEKNAAGLKAEKARLEALVNAGAK